MRIYVNELPESCNNCCFECYCFCCINSSYVIDNYFQDAKHKDCPLQSLSDYAKQVRKEVVQEIREKSKLFGACKTGIIAEEYRISKSILDEIEQGDNNG